MLKLLRKLWHSATGPSVPIRRPEGLSRRDFLRSMGVTAMSVGVGGMAGSLWRPLGPGKLYGARGEVLGDVPRKTGPGFHEFFAYQTIGAAFVDPRAVLNAELFGRLQSSDPAVEQLAINAVNDFTRVKMREDGFYRKIMPALSLPDDTLDVMRNWGVDEVDEQTRREIMRIGFGV